MTARSRRVLRSAGLVWSRVLGACVVIALGGCAVKGYDLGWRVEDRFAAVLGAPLDAASGCRWQTGRAVSNGCRALIADLDRVLAGAWLDAAEAEPGLSCRGRVCSYRNAYERRDIGVALVVPVFRRITLREVRARFERSDERWRVTELVVTDAPPPTYGPVRIGG